MKRADQVQRRLTQALPVQRRPQVDHVTLLAARSVEAVEDILLQVDAGNLSTTINVTVNGDRTVELNESFLVNLTDAGNATIADGQAVGTIQNDDGSGSTGPRSNQQTALILAALTMETADVIPIVSDLPLSSGQRNALIAHLHAVQDSLARGNTRAAAGQFNAAVDLLTALKKSRQLDEAEADLLIGQTEGIRSSLLEGR